MGGGREGQGGYNGGSGRALKPPIVHTLVISSLEKQKTRVSNSYRTYKTWARVFPSFGHCPVQGGALSLFGK